MYSNCVLPQVEPLCVFREGLWYVGEVSECTVDLFNTWTATGPRARRDSVDRADLQGRSAGVKGETADRMRRIGERG